MCLSHIDRYFFFSFIGQQLAWSHIIYMFLFCFDWEPRSSSNCNNQITLCSPKVEFKGHFDQSTLLSKRDGMPTVSTVVDNNVLCLILVSFIYFHHLLTSLDRKYCRKKSCFISFCPVGASLKFSLGFWAVFQTTKLTSLCAHSKDVMYYLPCNMLSDDLSC